MPAPPLLALTVGVRIDEPLPTFYAGVAILIAVTAALGSTAVPGPGRGWIVERIGVVAVIAWAAGFDAAMLARAFVTADAGGKTGAFVAATAVYLAGTAWTFSAARSFDSRWIMTSVGAAVIWLSAAALW